MKFSLQSLCLKQLHGYQKESVDWTVEQYGLLRTRGVGLFLEPGLGKTIVALKIVHFLKPRKTLIVAPKRVAEERWPEEICDWCMPLTWSVVTGTQKQREKALAADADLYLINPEGIPWLQTQKPATGVHRLGSRSRWVKRVLEELLP